MRPITFLLAFLMSCATAFQASAQGIISTETTGETEAQQLSFLTLQSDQAPAASDLLFANNGVFINQVGNDNTALVAIRSQVSDVNLLQAGDLNKMRLNLQADFVDYQALQLGTNNLLLEYPSLGNKTLLQRVVEQYGDNQSLIIHGQNSIIDKMRIRMEAGSQSLIIRNTQ